MVDNIAWYVYIICDYGLCFVGGSYSSLSVPPPICMFLSPCSVYPCGIYLHFCIFILCMPISLYAHTPIFTFFQLCGIYPQWDENFGGCMHMCYIICC